MVKFIGEIFQVTETLEEGKSFRARLIDYSGERSDCFATFNESEIAKVSRKYIKCGNNFTWIIDTENKIDKIIMHKPKILTTKEIKEAKKRAMRYSSYNELMEGSK
jgi:alpha-tubulin suppressor-like RCC1 family protein